MSVNDCVALLGELLPEPHAGLLAGLLFGTKQTLSPDFKQALLTTGTLHIIALSGMNISILSALLGQATTSVFGRKIALVLTLFVIWWFVWFVGPSSSIIRAASMGSLSILARVLGRQYWALFALFVTVVVMLAVHPVWIGDLSFRLSILSTLGILLFGQNKNMNVQKNTDEENGLLYSDHHASLWMQGMKNIGKGLGNLLYDDLRLTFSAQIFTIPLIAFTFHRVSLISPVTNILIGWVIAPLTGLGWITLGVAMVAKPLSYVVALIPWAFLEYLIRTIQIMSKLPFAGIEF